jgi:hypothetical protein
MIGGYNSLPLRVVPSSAGGGYFATYQARRTVTGLRRTFYAFLDAQGNMINNNEVSTNSLQEGYSTVAVDPVSGKPLYAWHADVDNDSRLEVMFTSDAFIAGIAGLFNDPQIIVDNPITLTSPAGNITTDNEFIWPCAVIGPSPIAGKRRVYVLSRNYTTHAYGPSENAYIRYADFDIDMIEGGIPLVWNTSNFTIPELDQWNEGDMWRRASLALTCDDNGNLYYCGYHYAYDPVSEMDVQEADLDVFKCTNYGMGTWSRMSAYSDLPSWNPPASPNGDGGFFLDENGNPYADNELKWVIMNSGHLNASIDGENRIHIPALWGLRNADGAYYKNLQVVKEFIFNPNAGAYQLFSIKEVYPRKDDGNGHDAYYQPWDTEQPWGVVDAWDMDANGVYSPQMATIWPFAQWDETLYNDAMMFHYNNVKVTEANNHGMMAMVWQDSQRARWYHVDGDTTYVNYANTPEIYIAISPNNGWTWYDPIVLNNVNTPQLAGMKPKWVYPADKMIFMGYNGSYNKVGKLGLIFYNDYDWYTSCMTPPVGVTNPGGQVMFMELQITVPEYYEDPIYVEMPSTNLPSGTYNGAIDVTLACATWGASILYTTDGSNPLVNGTTYTGPIHISQTTTLKAVGYSTFLEPSGIITRVYEIGVANPENPDTPLVTGISQLYPNPFSGSLAIKLGFKEANQDYQLKIYNLKGECVYEIQGIGTGKLDLAWDGTSDTGRRLPKGVYILSFKSGSTKQTRKITLM